MATRKVRYRRLKPGEVIRKGDQFLDCPGVWKTTRSAGCRVDGGFDALKYRRRVETPKPAEQPEPDYKAIVDKIASVFGFPPWRPKSGLLDWLTGQSAAAKRQYDRLQQDCDAYAENARKVIADLEGRLAVAETECKALRESRDAAQKKIEEMEESGADQYIVRRAMQQRDAARAAYDRLAEACRIVHDAGAAFQVEKEPQ